MKVEPGLPRTCQHCKLHCRECTAADSPNHPCRGWVHVVTGAHRCRLHGEFHLAEPAGVRAGKDAG